MNTEQERRQSNTARLLAYLKENKRATNQQLNHIAGFRYGARLLELRKEGHKISTNRIKDGVFLYEYNGHVDDDQKYENASLFASLEVDGE